MPDPAPTRRESSKSVPVGEPPTPEGWVIYVCPVCGDTASGVRWNERNARCAGFDKPHNPAAMVPRRVVPVGGAGVRLTDEEIEALLLAANTGVPGLNPGASGDYEVLQALARAGDKLRAASVGEGVEGG